MSARPGLIARIAFVPGPAAPTKTLVSRTPSMSVLDVRARGLDRKRRHHAGYASPDEGGGLMHYLRSLRQMR